MKYISLLILAISGILTIQADDLWHSAKSDYYMQRARSHHRSTQERIQYYDSLISQTGSAPAVDIYMEYAHLLETEGRYPDALKIYQTASKAKDASSPATDAKLRLATAVAAYHSNRMRDAIGTIYSLERMKLPDSICDIKMEGYRLLSYIAISSGNFEKASEYIEKAWKELRKAESSLSPEERKTLQCRLHFAKSEYFMESRNYPQALKHLRQARALSPDSLMMADICGSLGRICEHEGDLDAAEDMFREALRWTDTHPNRVVNIGNYVSLLLERGRLREADSLFFANEKFFDTFSGTGVERYIEQLRYNVLKKRGNEKAALESLEKLFALDDSIKSNQNSIYIKDLISEFENRDAEEIQRRMKQESRNKSIAIGILIILIAISIYITLRNRDRTKKIKQELLRLNNIIANIEEDNKNHQHEMENDLEKCNKELLTMSMHAKKVSESLDTIQSLIENDIDTPQTRIDKIGQHLKRLASQNNINKMVGVYFSRINHDFFDKLFRLHPDLSAAEIKLCGYILMGVSTKEIAEFTNRSVRTIENIKYTLRKKLNIEESTESYMRRISAMTTEEISTVMNTMNTL